MDIGKFVIDTSNIIGSNSNPSQEMFADRFIGPYGRNELNSLSMLGCNYENGEENSQSN